MHRPQPRRIIGFRFRDIRVHGTFATQFLGPSLVIDYQSVHDRLHKRTEPAALGIGVAKISAYELQREFLEDFVGGILIAEGGKCVATNRTTVVVEQPLLG